MMLPAARYSPDLNPIQRGFGWVKARLRRAFLDAPQSDGQVRKLIEDALRDLPASAMAGFFRACFWSGARPTAEWREEQAAVRVSEERARRATLLAGALVVVLSCRRR